MSNYWDELMATDEGAANYMESYGEGPGSETREILASLIKNRESVLDVGCGPGWNLNQFFVTEPDLIVRKYKGVDYSERFVRVANKRRRSMKIPTTRALPFEVQDCRDLKEPDKSWDVVILQDVLEHTNGYGEAIAEALRVARKRVIISFWKGSFQDGSDVAEDQINDDGDDGYGSTYSREKFEKTMTSARLNWRTLETPKGANRWHRFYVIELEKNDE